MFHNVVEILDLAQIGEAPEGFKTRVTAYIERSQSRREAQWTRSARIAGVSI
jgi:hypothetical protein